MIQLMGHEWSLVYVTAWKSVIAAGWNDCNVFLSVDNLDNSYATDYNPTIERGQNQPHYASLNKDKLGVKKSDQIPDERVVYAELKHSGAHHPQDAYV